MSIALHMHITFVLSGIDCSKAAGMLRDKYDKLSNLPYESMDGKLFCYKVITSDEKVKIDKLGGNKKMQEVLGIVIASLKCEQITKYSGFLQAMEESENTLLNEIAKELGKWINIHSSIKCACMFHMINC